MRSPLRCSFGALPSVWVRFVFLWIAAAPNAIVLAQNPCAMEILVFDSLTPCTQDLTSALGSALLVADGQCRTVQTLTDPSDPSYTLFPGNYRAECVNSTVVRILESGCISPQCNSTSLVSGATCDRNNSIAGSLYSRVEVPEFPTYPSRDGSYRCTQAQGSNVTVSFVIFGDCSSPTCLVTNAPVATPAPSTFAPVSLAPATPAPVNEAPIVVTPPSFEGTTPPTATPKDNPTPTPVGGGDSKAPVRAPTADGSPPSAPATPTPNAVPTPTTAVVEQSSNGGGISAGVIAGIGVGVAVLAMLWVGLVLHRRRLPSRGKTATAKEIGFDDDEGSDHVVSRATTGKSPEEEERGTTNEIWIDPNADEVSTLGGGTLQPFGGMGQDEPTASVNLDFDFHRNQYRTGDIEDRTQSQQTTASTAFTTLSKLGLRGAPEFADDLSFEEQFAELDDDAEGMTAVDPIASRVKPFEVRAPPGKLGMVVDTPNGGVPVVRAIKPDSVLSGHVQMGDRLISVDHINVTSMSALEVSNLISLKQNQTRLLIFCRLNPPAAS